jgi:hypothetical protein
MSVYAVPWHTPFLKKVISLPASKSLVC